MWHWFTIEDKPVSYIEFHIPGIPVIHLCGDDNPQIDKNKLEVSTREIIWLPQYQWSDPEAYD